MNRTEALASRLLALCEERRIMFATAESCTGGLVASAVTAIPGSSAIFDRGFVTYSNDAKIELLGVGPSTLERFGAVSAETAAEMAQGALDRSAAALAVSVTGIAGPGGGSPEKPVGLVWFGLAQARQAASTQSRQFPDKGRDAIRAMAAEFALRLAVEALLADQPMEGLP